MLLCLLKQSVINIIKNDIETKHEVACKDLQDTQRQKVEIAEDNARLKRSGRVSNTNRGFESQHNH